MNNNFENAKYLTRLFLINNKSFNYGREIKIANKLLSQFPESEFWADRKEFFGKLNSLAFFVRADINSNLRKEYNLFLLDKQKNTLENFENSDIIDVIKPAEIIKKPKNLIDFLDS